MHTIHTVRNKIFTPSLRRAACDSPYSGLEVFFIPFRFCSPFLFPLVFLIGTFYS